MPGPSCANRIRPGTCGRCAWFLPPFHDKHWKGRVRKQAAGRCSVRENEPRYRDQSCDLIEDGTPIGSDPSWRMSALNRRMKRKNSAIKRRCIDGMRRVRQDPAYRAIQGAVLREIMSRPGMREKAVAHAVAINRTPEVRAKQWASRRAKKAAGIPPDTRNSRLRNEETRTLMPRRIPTLGYRSRSGRSSANVTSSPRSRCASRVPRRRTGAPSCSTPKALDKLRPHAEARRVGVNELVRMLIDRIVDDSLVDAILDDSPEDEGHG